MKGLTRAAWAAALFVVVCTVRGQRCEPGWTEGFPNAPGINAEVRSLAMFDDGHGPVLYVSGHFTAAGGSPAAGITRRNGDQWEALGEGLGPGGVGSWIGVLDDGTGAALYVGGLFSSAGGLPASNVACWDGTAWSTLGTGTNNTVRAMTVFDDGTGPAIYAVGFFTQAGSVTANGIARWKDGTWSPVGAGLTNGPGSGSGKGYCIGVYDLGSGQALYVGGQFLYAGGIAAHGVAKWDGSTWSALGDGVNATVMAMVIADDGAGPKLHAGGQFGPSGYNLARVVKWTGASWVQVGPDLSGASSQFFVGALAVLDDPSGPTLYAGGDFFNASGTDAHHIARFDGTTWRSLDGATNGHVRSLITVEEGGAQVLHVGGQFDHAGSTVASRVARWDGEHWSGFEHNLGLSTTYSFEDICEYDGRIYVCGVEFSTAGNVFGVKGIAAWDGSDWHGVGGGFTFDSNTLAVNAMTVFDDGAGSALYVTGNFIAAGGIPCMRIARWDGTTWSSVGAAGLNKMGRALAVADDGSGPALYVGGGFTQVGSLEANTIARWNGVEWSTVGETSSLTQIESLTAFNDGTGPELYARAFKSNPPGFPIRVVIRWDGMEWHELPALGVEIKSNLVVYDDGSGQALYGALDLGQGLVRWNGSAWQSSASPNVGAFPILRVLDDGRGSALFLGGSGAGNVRYHRSGQWHTMGSGVDSRVEAMGVGHLNGLPSLYVAGKFIGMAGGHPTKQFAEWRGCPPCHADCTADGTLNINDFICFQTKFALGDPYADCDNNGAHNLNDFICFQTEFALGCS